jgi:hypothetical protein
MTRVLTLIGAAAPILAAVIYWPASPASATPRPLLADAAIIAFLGALLVLAAKASRRKWLSWAAWVACGGLLGAMAAGPLILAPWFLAASMAFAVAAMIGGLGGLGGLGGILRRFAVIFTAAFINFAFLWPLLTGNHIRATPAEFRALDLRVHALLSDVPLHDIWVFHLRGGGDERTLADTWAALSDQPPTETNTTVAWLVALRMAIGQLSGWDDDKHFDAAASYVRRLTDADRSRSSEEPGTSHGLFRTVYTFENEALVEMMNRTAHAFFCTALVPAEDGYRMYWAIYVKRTSWLTPVYMALIDPFRRVLVYPAIVRSVERAWSRRWGKDPH